MPVQNAEQPTAPFWRRHAHEEIQGGLWLIGIAVIVWQGWYWPGLLILAGLSAVIEGIIRFFGSLQS